MTNNLSRIARVCIASHSSLINRRKTGDTSMITVTLTDRELATVLASLRALQNVQQHEPPAAGITEIASSGGTLEPLTDGEVDTLCERLNFGTSTAL
jgi:hypothetical protein